MILRYCFLFLILALSRPGFSQTPSGTWRLGYSKSLEFYFQIDPQNDSAFATDESYYQYNNAPLGILEMDSENVSIHFENDSSFSGMVKGETIIDSLNGETLFYLSYNSDSLVLREKINKENHLVFYPYAPHEVDISNIKISNSLWGINAANELNNFKLHFEDNSGLISLYHGEYTGSATNGGSWKVEHIKNYWILTVRDAMNIGLQNFYITDRVADTLKAQYALRAGSENSEEVSLYRVNQITESERLRVSTLLAGKWVLNEFLEYSDPVYLDILKAEFSIEFKLNGNFTMEYNLMNMENGLVKRYSSRDSGNWKFGLDGTYLILDVKRKWTDTYNRQICMSMHSLNEKFLVLDMDFQSDHNEFFQARIEMKKLD